MAISKTTVPVLITGTHVDVLFMLNQNMTIKKLSFEKFEKK